MRKFLQDDVAGVSEEPTSREVFRGILECGCWAVFGVVLFPAIILSHWGDDYTAAQSYLRAISNDPEGVEAALWGQTDPTPA